MSDSGAAAAGESVVADTARPWLLDGVTSQTVATPRLQANVLSAGSGSGVPVVLVHGNVSSAHLYQQTMLALSGPSIAIDLRGFGDSETLPVDATRGLGDYADDVASVLDALGIAKAVLVGWSMGGGVVMRLLLDRPDLVAGLVLESPVSPYGFGGTRLDGSLVHPDAPGTGGGGANPDFVARLAAGDTSTEAATSPRSVFRAAYVAPGYASDDAGGWIEEHQWEGVGHAPHLERVEEFAGVVEAMRARAAA